MLWTHGLGDLVPGQADKQRFLASVKKACYTHVTDKSCEVQNPLILGMDSRFRGGPALQEPEFSRRRAERLPLASKSRPSFVKRQRERDQKLRRKLKGERRMERRAMRAVRVRPPVGDLPEAIAVITETIVPPAEDPADTV